MGDPKSGDLHPLLGVKAAVSSVLHLSHGPMNATSTRQQVFHPEKQVFYSKCRFRKTEKYFRKITLIVTVDRHLQATNTNKMDLAGTVERDVTVLNALSLDLQQIGPLRKLQQVEVMVQTSQPPVPHRSALVSCFPPSVPPPRHTEISVEKDMLLLMV